MTDDVKHVSLEEFNRITAELDRARELREADTSRMTLAEKVEHKRAIKQAMEKGMGK